MIKILVADDNERKIKNLRNILDQNPGISAYEVAVDLISTRRFLTEGYFDLLILDLNLPNRIGDDPLPENGGDFIKELKKSVRFIKPGNIIGLSAYDESIKDYKLSFEDDLWGIVKYEDDSNSWSKTINDKLNYLIQSKQDILSNLNSSYDYDIGIVTALRRPELESILNLPIEWKAFKVKNDPTEYFKGLLKTPDKNLRVVAASSIQMGMVAAAVLTQKLIMNFRPKHVAMTGIAGGVKGIGNFGDILAADISFDSGSGKIRKDSSNNSIFEPDFRSINIQSDLKEAIQQCQDDEDLLIKIKKDWLGNKPNTELVLHIGPMASGAGVIQDSDIIKQIKGHHRKLIGIDMETYGVFYACQNSSKPRPKTVLSLKSISDFADSEKNDNYQKYASYTSASFLYHFIMEKYGQLN